MTEMGLGGGVECEARRGYHLREADLYFEIIDPATGRVLPDGEYGEVVFTTLTRRGMPLVRYRTGDVSRFIPGKCSCGTHLKTLERITHRLAGRVFIGDRPLTMADLDEALFAIDGVLNFTATLIRNEHGDELQLAAKTVADVDVTATIKQALMMLTSPPAVAPSLPKSAVRFREKGLGGEALSINVLIVPDIPPSMAKRTILDRRPSA
jgi:phenylacetate-coenzyme A ligase PaaK-like adenylate-forming protein